MDDIAFAKSFAFCKFEFCRYRKTDKSMGTRVHHIGYLLEGRAEFVTEDARLSFSAGDVFYIPPGCKYHSYWYGEERIAFESYAFTYLPAELGIRYPLQKMPMNAAAEAALAALSAHRTDKCLAVGYLYALLGHTLPEMQPEKRDTKAELVARAQGYMHTHRDFTVPEVAKYCRVSTSGLYAAFQKTLGHTPIDEKHIGQVEYAVTLLSSTDLSVEEVSARAGFCSAAYFRKILRQLTGKTPGQYRKTECL